MPKCDECGKEFGTEGALSQHLKDKHGVTAPAAEKPTGGQPPKGGRKPKSLRQRNRHTTQIAVGAVAAALIVGLYFVVAPAAGSYPIPCVPPGNLAEHIHPYLRIDIQGQYVSIPGDVGYSSACAEPVHTHDGSGILHIETGTMQNVTLGQFFEVWAAWAKMGSQYAPTLNGATLPVVFNSTDILGFRANSTMAVTLLVNGTPYSGSDPGQLILNEYDYCTATSSAPPCSPTATDSPPYYNGGTYPWATNQTLVIQYATKG